MASIGMGVREEDYGGGVFEEATAISRVSSLSLVSGSSFGGLIRPA